MGEQIRQRWRAVSGPWVFESNRLARCTRIVTKVLLCMLSIHLCVGSLKCTCVLAASNAHAKSRKHLLR
jgi:hypothetical protein